jgi:hypothetical protein
MEALGIIESTIIGMSGTACLHELAKREIIKKIAKLILSIYLLYF